MNLEFRFIYVIVTLIPGFHKTLLQINALFISRMIMNLMHFYTALIIILFYFNGKFEDFYNADETK